MMRYRQNFSMKICQEMNETLPFLANERSFVFFFLFICVELGLATLRWFQIEFAGGFQGQYKDMSVGCRQRSSLVRSSRVGSGVVGSGQVI